MKKKIVSYVTVAVLILIGLSSVAWPIPSALQSLSQFVILGSAIGILAVRLSQDEPGTGNYFDP